MSERDKGTTSDAAGPVDEEHHGEIVEDGPEAVAPPPAEAGHVSGDLEWVPSDEDDPDAGSGRTDADDGGYLPGEGTGRPPGE